MPTRRSPLVSDPARLLAPRTFEENFPTLASHGKFLAIYKMWSAYPKSAKSTDKQGIYDPANIAVVDVDGVRAMELRIVSGKNNGLGVPSGANPQPRLYGPSKDGYTTGERIELRCKLYRPGPGGHWVPLGWPRYNSDWPADGEPDVIPLTVSPT